MLKKTAILLLLAFAALASPAQNKGLGPKEPSAKEEMAVRRQQRREAKEKRKMEKAERKKIKAHHKRIQTKKVQKRMKESRKRADRNNANKGEFFMKRWFTKKSRPTQRKD